MILELSKKLLKTPTTAWNLDDEEQRTQVTEIIANLKETMLQHNAYGLSANQVEIPKSVFVFGDPKNADSIKAAINPRIVHESEEKQLLLEGCLSFPNLFIKIKRPKSIRVRYTNENFEVKTETFIGLTARIFSHEKDHLDGLTIMDRAGYYHKMKARTLQRKLEKNVSKH